MTKEMLYGVNKAEGRNEFDYDWDKDQSFSDLKNSEVQVPNSTSKVMNNNLFGISSKRWIDDDLKPTSKNITTKVKLSRKDIKIKNNSKIDEDRANMKIDDWDD